MQGSGIVGVLADVPRAVALGDFWSKIGVPVASVVLAPFTGGASLALNSKKNTTYVKQKVTTKHVGQIAGASALVAGSVVAAVFTAGALTPLVGASAGILSKTIQNQKNEEAQRAANVATQQQAAQLTTNLQQQQAALDALPWYERLWQEYPYEVTAVAGLATVALIIRGARR